MPIAVFVLALSTFVLGTSEFMLSGLLPEIASDLGVSIPDAGLLISAFAVGMLVGAPTMAAATLRLRRKLTLIATLLVFLAGHVVAALAPTYGVLFGTRVVSAVAAAGFWAVAAVTTIGLVPVERRGRAMATLVGGLTVANVLGVPAGTFVGQHAGWRSAFWVVAALSTVAIAGVLLAVPSTERSSAGHSLRTEFGVYRNPRLWLALLITASSTAMTIATFSYLSPLLTDAAGLSAGWVPAVLGLYGVGALLGVGVGGRLADLRPWHTLAAGITGTMLVLVALALGGTRPVVAVTGALLLGLTGFVINPALNVRVFALAADAPTLAGATNVSAFNTGILAAPWLGGLTIGAGLGYLSVTWVSLALGAVALAALAVAAQRETAPELELVS